MKNNIMAIFDTQKQAAEGAVLHFVNPKDGKPVYSDKEKKIPLSVTMIGKASLEYLGTQSIKELRKLREKTKDKKHDSGIEDTFFTDSFEEQARKLSEVVKSWTGFEDENGPIKFSKKKAYEMFLQYGALRVQAINFLDNDKNFIQG